MPVIRVVVVNEDGQPLRGVPVAAYSTANFPEILARKTTDDAGVASFTVNERVFFDAFDRRGVSFRDRAYQGKVQIQILGVDNFANYDYVVSRDGYGTHLALFGTGGALEAAMAASFADSGYVRHIWVCTSHFEIVTAPTYIITGNGNSRVVVHSATSAIHKRGTSSLDLRGTPTFELAANITVLRNSLNQLGARSFKFQGITFTRSTTQAEAFWDEIAAGGGATGDDQPSLDFDEVIFGTDAINGANGPLKYLIKHSGNTGIGKGELSVTNCWGAMNAIARVASFSDTAGGSRTTLGGHWRFNGNRLALVNIYEYVTSGTSVIPVTTMRDNELTVSNYGIYFRDQEPPFIFQNNDIRHTGAFNFFEFAQSAGQDADDIMITGNRYYGTAAGCSFAVLATATSTAVNGVNIVGNLLHGPGSGTAIAVQDVLFTNVKLDNLYWGWTTSVSGAPAGSTPVYDNEPFVTVGNPSTLTAERALTAGSGLAGVDGGANAAYTLSLGPLTALWSQTGVFDIEHAGNLRVAKYLRVGSTAAPTNTNIGDFTAGRIFVNNDTNFSLRVLTGFPFINMDVGDQFAYSRIANEYQYQIANTPVAVFNASYMAHQSGMIVGSPDVSSESLGASVLARFESTTKGIQFPRMTTAQRDAIASPAEGLLIYNTDTDRYEYYNVATLAWAPVAGAGGTGNVATDPIWDAKGDLAVGTGADTAVRLAVGADDTILMADSAQATGLKWVGSGTPTTQLFGDAAAQGTTDGFARVDHKHGMPADPVTAHVAAGDPHTVYALESAFRSGTAVRYVAKTGSDANDGLSWVTAKLTVKAAVLDLPTAGSGTNFRHEGIVHIGTGEFLEDGNIEVNERVAFIGQGSSDSGTNTTLIKLKNAGNAHLFTFTSSFLDWSHYASFRHVCLDGNKANQTPQVALSVVASATATTLTKTAAGWGNITGTATGVTATTMTDTVAAWTVDQFIGHTVTLGGVRALVTSNTATVLTFLGGWQDGATPATGAYKINPYVGSVVKIVSGTGIGQTRRITAHDATTLTISPTWATTPDTTSNFTVHGYDVVRIALGGFGCYFEDVSIINADRFGLNVLDKATDVDIYACTGSGCNGPWYHQNFRPDTNGSVVNIIGAQVDNCGYSPIHIEGAANGNNLVNIIGGKFEGLSGTHENILLYTRISGSNGVRFLINGTYGWADTTKPYLVRTEGTTGGRAHFSISNLVGSGYTSAFRDDDIGYTFDSNIIGTYNRHNNQTWEWSGSEVLKIVDGVITKWNLFDAKGDLMVATAADVPGRLAVGANDAILMADSAQATGLKWAAAATTTEIADVAMTEAAGTSDTYTRGDHVHSLGTIKQSLMIVGWQPTTTAGAGAQEKIEVGTTTKHDFLTCPFDSVTAESAFATIPMPDNYDGGTVTFRVWWLCKTGYVLTTSDGVAWGLKATAYGDGDVIDTAYGTEITVTDTGTANNEARKSADSAALTIGNTPAAGDLVHWVLTRKVADAADDWAADAYPLAVVVEYGITGLSA